MITKIQKLNFTEIATLNMALNSLIDHSATNSDVAWAAKAMLEQKMPENFFWATQ